LLRKLVLAYRLNQATGILVVKVEENSPAGEVGLREGDIIVTFDGKPAERIESLHRTLTADRIGLGAELRVLRGVEYLTLTLTPGESPG
jgi:serine protease Do